jgi:signal transduction histidine kinase
MQEEFINVASHEIRTPTQSILGYSELLLDQPENGKNMIQAIYRNASRLQRLTNDILDVTRIESGTLKLNKEKFNMVDLLSGIMKDFRNDIQKKDGNIELLLLLSSSEPTNDLLIEADKGRITQVISNLLSNAIKFTPGGTISIHVMKKNKVDNSKDNSQKQKQEEVILSIKDTGTGIDSEILPRLFTKFATKSFEGTGLGLFISKGIVEAHGGRMWAENNADGRGAKFAFSIPIS